MRQAVIRLGYWQVDCPYLPLLWNVIMQCPSCGDKESVRASHTRTDSSNNTIIRRRMCTACDHRWYTAEVPIPTEAVGHGFNESRTQSTFTLKGSITYTTGNHDSID